MDNLGKKLFSGPGFARDENIDVAAGGLGQKFQTRSDLLRISDNAVSFQNDRGFPDFLSARYSRARIMGSLMASNEAGFSK